jgi:hypothetical protein
MVMTVEKGVAMEVVVRGAKRMEGAIEEKLKKLRGRRRRKGVVASGSSGCLSRVRRVGDEGDEVRCSGSGAVCGASGCCVVRRVFFAIVLCCLFLFLCVWGAVGGWPLAAMVMARRRA